MKLYKALKLRKTHWRNRSVEIEDSTEELIHGGFIKS